MYIKELREAVARGWCHPDTEHLIIDPILAEAIIAEVWKIDKTPNLGCATTAQLINELQARSMVANVNGETWPEYKTTDHH